MSEIQLLNKVTQDQIAAGEVIDRPASVLKELIENSLDANSTKIDIEIKEGGKTLIRVMDDGDGIEEKELSLSVKRYATSKIREISDLGVVKSFGFRGEALASIAAVSRLTIVSSKRDTDKTFKIVVDGGNEEYLEQTTNIIGTDISIENIFFNVPARRKFLKNDSTEFRAILKQFNQIALENYKVSFRLTHNDKLLVDLPKTDSWFARICDIYPQNITNHLIPISFQTPDVSLTGFIAKPEGLTKQKYYQALYINDRIVQDRTIYKALFDGYKGLIVKGLSPIFFLSLSILPELVDINIHPQKKEIKLLNPSDIYKVVYSAVKNGIYGEDSHEIQGIEQEIQNIKHIDYSTGEILNEAKREGYKEEGFNLDFDTTIVEGEKQVLNEETFDKPYRILGQIKKSYILLETKDQFWIVDQHAAHERILYEKFKNSFEKKDIIKQNLAIPLMIDLTTDEILLFKENKDVFTSLGFDIEFFDDKSLIVEAIPSLVTKNSITTEFIKEIFDNLADTQNYKKLNKKDLIDKKLQSMSCRSAVMFGDKLNIQEMEDIVSSLENLKIPYCPHGRPAVLRFDWEDLEKMFKRVL